MTEENGREAAALRAQVAYLAVTGVPHRYAKLSVRPDGEERTHTESLGLVEMGRKDEAADFMRQRLKAEEKDIMRGVRATSLAPRATQQR